MDKETCIVSQQTTDLDLTAPVTSSACPSQMSAKNDMTFTDAKESGYPTYGLDEALKIGQAVYDLGGSRSPVKREMLAKHLKFAASGPSFVQRLGSARIYGLVEGRGHAGYLLTDIAKAYFLPTNETAKGEAAFQALRKPSVFAKIIDRFQGQRLPANQLLGNIIHTESGIPESWKDKVASLFVKSATAIGALDSQGVLKAVDSTPIARQEREGGDGDSHGGEQRQPDEKQKPPPPGTHTHTLPLANQRKVTINAPLDVTPQEITRIQKWIEVTLLVDWYLQPTNKDDT